MTITIHASTKFENAPEQYFVGGGGHTLLRLTYGMRDGMPGGTIMTATACDDWSGAPRPYPDRHALIESMRRCLLARGALPEHVTDMRDSKARPYADIVFYGTRDELKQEACELADAMLEDMALDRAFSGKSRSSGTHSGGYDDLRDLYDDLCVVDGEAVYLSDGVYLGPDGHMFE